ncbi:hypothetical protein CK203_106193 [Vitis vinifera]|uniref:Uncharacterized protein n=1 Tax=Vitis vinifera TaxID=29760 RepID=A0A438CXS4_VITVI|nr:hypothetical protein CK203_106193 [Vitis vinifera]
MVERRGKPQVIIMESKRGVSSWVHLGLASVGFFLERLYQCLEDVKEGKWEKGWKEKGRSFSLVRDANRAGSFLRLGVVDSKKKRYNICIPKGRGEKGGWLSMVEALRKLDDSLDKKEQNRKRGHRRCRRGGFGKVGMGNGKILGLKGKLGLASLGKGRALLEFEFVEEARRVLISGKRAMGGVQLGLERWSLRSGCLEESEAINKVWVRILGLPISLWVRQY